MTYTCTAHYHTSDREVRTITKLPSCSVIMKLWQQFLYICLFQQHQVTPHRALDMQITVVTRTPFGAQLPKKTTSGMPSKLQIVWTESEQFDCFCTGFIGGSFTEGKLLLNMQQSYDVFIIIQTLASVSWLLLHVCVSPWLSITISREQPDPKVACVIECKRKRRSLLLYRVTKSTPKKCGPYQDTIYLI